MIKKKFPAATGTNNSGNRSLEASHLNRNGLSAGTIAPAFSLPRVGGGEIALKEYQGHWVLLVFSDPGCGPCTELAPHLEQLHRRRPELRVLMVSRGDERENLAKASEHSLTFPIVLQRRWATSRAYGMFATPIGYLINDLGTIVANVASGVNAILSLENIYVRLTHSLSNGEMLGEHLHNRLVTLKNEFEIGQTGLRDLERQELVLRERMLRIAGAIQVLEEVLAKGPAAKPDGKNVSQMKIIDSQERTA